MDTTVTPAGKPFVPSPGDGANALGAATVGAAVKSTGAPEVCGAPLSISVESFTEYRVFVDGNQVGFLCLPSLPPSLPPFLVCVVCVVSVVATVGAAAVKSTGAPEVCGAPRLISVESFTEYRAFVDGNLVRREGGKDVYSFCSSNSGCSSSSSGEQQQQQCAWKSHSLSLPPSFPPPFLQVGYSNGVQQQQRYETTLPHSPLPSSLLPSFSTQIGGLLERGAAAAVRDHLWFFGRRHGGD